MNRAGFPRYVWLALGFIALLFDGVIYAWSVLKAPFSQEFSWRAFQLSLNFTITMCFFCLGGILAGFLIRKEKARAVIGIGGGIISLSFFGVSTIREGELWKLYLCYGVCAGLGVGLVYNALISSVGKWFPDKKGLCSGVLMMGFGFSSLLIGNAADALFWTEGIGWRMTFQILGIASGIVLILTALLLQLPKNDMKIIGEEASEDGGSSDYTPAKMLKRSSFWKYCAFNIFLAAAGSTMISFAKDFIMEVGVQTAMATVFVGILSVCNGLGRVICGVLYDKIGRRKTMLFGNIINIAAPVLALAALTISSAVLGIISMVCCGISYGFSPTIGAAFFQEFYGKKYFPINFSIGNTTLIFASMAAAIAGILVDSTGTYIAPFLLLTVFSVISIIADLSIRKA